MNRKRIDRGLIEHLMGNPEKEIPQNPATYQSQNKTSRSPIIAFDFSIEDLINNGKSFLSEKKKDGNWIGVPTSLNEALEYIGKEGIIATMPFLVAGKAKASKDNYLWQDWFSAHSEENIIPDTEGILTSSGKSVYLCVHGGGLLTPEKFFKDYDEGLTNQNVAKYTLQEASDLLNGILPNGDQIDMYHVDDVANGKILNQFGRYGVWMEFDEAKQFESKYYDKTGFKNNKVAHVRVGTLEYIADYYDKASNNNGLRCTHRFDEIDPKVAQGRFLFVGNTYYGLVGRRDSDNDGRFVGVVPKAHRGS